MFSPNTANFATTKAYYAAFIRSLNMIVCIFQWIEIKLEMKLCDVKAMMQLRKHKKYIVMSVSTFIKYI